MEGGLSLIIVCALYFLPAIIALHRQHPQQVPILLLNLFLGWTFLGWIAALIWSASNSAPTQIIIQNNVSALQVSPAPLPITRSDSEYKVIKLLEVEQLRKGGFLSDEEYQRKRLQIIGS